MGDYVNNELWKNGVRISWGIIFLSLINVIIDIITQQYEPFAIIDSVFFAFGWVLFLASLYKSHTWCFFDFIVFLGLMFVRMYQIMNMSDDFLNCKHHRCSGWLYDVFAVQFWLYALVEGLVIITIYICYQLLRTNKKLSEDY